MKKLANNIKWDLLLMMKYGIIGIALGITAVYSISLWLWGEGVNEKLVVFLVFSDPVMYGFLFVSVIVLFEKDARIHQVLAVTPMPANRHLWSKAISFSLLALVCSLLIIFAAQPATLNLPIFVFAVLASAILFVFVAVSGVSYVQNFNQFFLMMPVVLAPVCLPFLDFFDLWHSPLLYLIPTQACLVLFEASVSNAMVWEIIYGISYLLVWMVLGYYHALHSYKVRILHKS